MKTRCAIHNGPRGDFFRKNALQKIDLRRGMCYDFIRKSQSLWKAGERRMRGEKQRMLMQRRVITLFLTLAILCAFLPAHAAAQNGSKLIALTFDDGPCKGTARLLDALRARGVRATFFMLGVNAKKYPAIVKRAYDEGHEIASHSNGHPLLSGLTDAQIRDQVSVTKQALDAAIGCTNDYLFRPPYGERTERILKQLDAPAILWSVDSNDWRHVNDAETTANEIVSHAYDGSIILIHDIHTWSVDAAIRAVDILTARGFTFVTVSELFRRRGEPLQNGQVYYSRKATGSELPAASAPVIEKIVTREGSFFRISADPGAAVYYTTDGTQPDAGSPRYTDPVPLTGTQKICAVTVYKWNGGRSETACVTLTAESRETAPAVTVDQDGLTTISAAAPIFYTTDGSVPTEESRRYERPFHLSKGAVLQTIAYTPNGLRPASEIVRRCYSGEGRVYTDVFPSDWYYEATEFAAANGLLYGTKDGAMMPYGRLTRGDAITAIYRLEGSPAVSPEGAFIDVPADAWYAPAAAWGKSTGIFSGDPDGSFHPNESVSREQLAVLFCRCAEAWLCLPTDAPALSETFRDRGDVSDPAAHATAWAVSKGLLSAVQDGCELLPGSTATRAQFAAALLHFADYAKANTSRTVTL